MKKREEKGVRGRGKEVLEDEAYKKEKIEN